MSTDRATSRKTVLITGGRAPAALELARLFGATGHRVLIADSLPNFLSKSSRFVERAFQVSAPNQRPAEFIEELCKIIRDNQVDLLIPTCEEVFFVSRGIDRLSELCEVFVDRPEKLAMLHSKWTFNREAASLGLAAPDTKIVADREEMKQVLMTMLPAVIKPVFSRFASKAFVIKRIQDFEIHSNDVEVSRERPWVVQKFVQGRELCSYSVVKNGALLAHSAYSHEFTAGKGAGISFESIDHAGIRQWVEGFAKKIEFTGQISFDFIETADGEIFPLECNPRATSGVHLFVPEDRLDQAFLNPARGEVLRPADGRTSLITLALLLYGLPMIRSVRQATAFAKLIVFGKEAVFSWTDPKPFFNQFACLFYFWQQSRIHRRTMLEMSTFDIEWNGG